MERLGIWRAESLPSNYLNPSCVMFFLQFCAIEMMKYPEHLIKLTLWWHNLNKGMIIWALSHQPNVKPSKVTSSCRHCPCSVQELMAQLPKCRPTSGMTSPRLSLYLQSEAARRDSCYRANTISPNSWKTAGKYALVAIYSYSRIAWLRRNWGILGFRWNFLNLGRENSQLHTVTLSNERVGKTFTIR